MALSSSLSSQHVKALLSSWAVWWSALVIGEIALCSVIIAKKRYTEIDWSTYMEQVSMVGQGERDYGKIRGEQGPLVYPAGFVWLYSLLRRWTKGSVAAAQPYFAAMLVADSAVVGRMYWLSFSDSNRFAPFMLCTFGFLRRAHSVFVLRLFNDGPCALLTHAAAHVLVAFPENGAALACVIYSLAVSVKMSALLYAPAWYLVLASKGGHRYAWTRIALFCGTTQILVALPFLAVNPRAYVSRAFNFGRGFKHKWSVNFRWIPCAPLEFETDLEDCDGLFSSNAFKLVTLACHALFLILFARKRWMRCDLYTYFTKTTNPKNNLTTLQALSLLFECNLVGMAFARSLHFQFNVWYSNSLPFIAACTELPKFLQLVLLLSVEAAWNPWRRSADSSSTASSLLLTVSHLTLLLALLYAKPLLPPPLHQRTKHNKQS